jgi:uncharacterized RDD family membrane protein YckC
MGVSAPANVADGVDESLDPADHEWRREVSRRLEAYRVRRGRPRPDDDSQSGLPFSRRRNSFRDENEADEVELTDRPRSRPLQRVLHRKSPYERVEIDIQPELNFVSSPSDRAHPQSALVPVAGLAERRRAGALDALFLAVTYAGFIALFRSLGGQLMLEKVDAIVHLAVFFLFYAQYFFLFTTFAGSTPGMQLRGLTIVRLDGSLPDTRQLFWRSFGYLLSGVTVMMGFIWSLWDEDRFTWHDRISQTYITAANPIMEHGAFELQPVRRRLAHKS